MTQQKVIVLGAGMVGTCTALALQRAGAQVTLIDRKDPGRETSYGNAGILARSSLIPLNNPGLWKSLPHFAMNKTAAIRYDPQFLLRHLPWLFQFLSNARPARCLETATALNQLVTYSIQAHLSFMQEFGLTDHLSDKGWVHLYRAEKGFTASQANRDIMTAHDVPFEILDADDIQNLEPCLAPIFKRAVWIKGSYSVNNPGAIVSAYARAFSAAGGDIKRAEASTLSETETGVSLTCRDGHHFAAEKVVICTGPWAKPFLEANGYSVRMAYERGYHRHFSGATNDATTQSSSLGRPIYDTSGGYVLAPMQAGLRMTTGVELADQNAPENWQQLKQAEQAARQAIDLGHRADDQTWMGSRPTFPDSRPVIGWAPGSRKIALGFGHQHIGFMSGTGTGRILSDLVMGRDCALDPSPFDPNRFIHKH